MFPRSGMEDNSLEFIRGEGLFSFCASEAVVALFWRKQKREWRGFPDGSVVRNPPANAGDVGSIPDLGRSQRKEKKKIDKVKNKIETALDDESMQLSSKEESFREQDGKKYQ